jgi:hypothetical protein
LIETKPKLIAATVRRKAEAFSYEAGQAVVPSEAKLLTFARCIPEGGNSLLLSAQLISKKGFSGKLLLFSGCPSPPEDGKAVDPSRDDIRKFLFSVDFSDPLAKVEEIGEFQSIEVVSHKIAESADRNLYGILVAKEPYAAIAEEEFLIRLGFFPRELRMI